MAWLRFYVVGPMRAKAVPLGMMAALVLWLAAAAVPSRADEELADPVGKVILRIDGAIGRTNRDGAAVFDRAMLEALPSATIVTRTPWTDGETTFEGPLARSVLGLVEAQGTEVWAAALDDFAATIPIDDFERYDVILALKMNGEPMRIRDRGPLWVIYPWSDHPSLITETYHGRSVWQLKSLQVR